MGKFDKAFLCVSKEQSDGRARCLGPKFVCFSGKSITANAIQKHTLRDVENVIHCLADMLS